MPLMKLYRNNSKNPKQNQKNHWSSEKLQNIDLHNNKNLCNGQ